MKMPSHIHFILFSALVLSNCQDTITLDVPSGGVTDIAINAKLVFGDPSILEVSIGELFDFDGNPNYISVKFVELQDDHGNSTQIKFQSFGIYSKKIYDNDPDITIRTDGLYKLRIGLANDNIVESDFQNLFRVPRNNTVQQEIFRKVLEKDDGLFVDRPAIRFTTQNQVPEDNNTKLKLDILRTYKFSNLNFGVIPPGGGGFCNNAPNRRISICELLQKEPDHPSGLYDCDDGGVSNAVECDLGTDPLDSSDDGQETIISRSCYMTGFEDKNNIKLYDPAKDQSGNSFFTQELFEPTFGFKFAEGFYLRVITETLNQASYDYFEKIQEVTSLSGSMFDPPAGKINGNFKNTTNEDAIVYGYFYVTEQDTINQFIEPKTEIQDIFCLMDFKGFPPETCNDCTLWGNSSDEVSVIRPPYWPKN